MKKIVSSPSLPLLGIIILGFLLRFTGLNWDDFSKLHPDERFVVGITSKISLPQNLTPSTRERCPNEADHKQYFNTACSSLNPNNIEEGSYAYGTLPLFMVRGTATIVSTLTGDDKWLSYDYLQFVGRGLNALLDSVAIGVIYLIGRRLTSLRGGMIAAALYAFAVLPIQLAHFWTVDIIAHFFFLIGLYAAIGIAQTGRWPWYSLFGLMLGCTLASRINLLPMLALLPLAMGLYIRTNHGLERRIFIQRGFFAVVWMLLALGLAVMTFRIFQPYAFAGPDFTDTGLNERWLSEIIEVSNLSRVYSVGWPPSSQWEGRISYLYPWWNMMMWGLGGGLGIAVTLAFGWTLFYLGRRVSAYKSAWRVPIAALVMVGIAWFLVDNPLDLLQESFTSPYGWVALSGIVAISIGVLLAFLAQLPRLPEGMILLVGWVVIFFALQGGSHQMTMRYYLPLYAPLILLLAGWLLQIHHWPTRRALTLGLLGATLLWAFAFHNIYRHTLSRLEASRYMMETMPATLNLVDRKGDWSPTNLEDTSTYSMMTVYNGESYLGQSFEITDDRQISGLSIHFMDAKPAVINIRFITEEDVEPKAPLAAFTLHTDENGMANLVFGEGEFPEIEAGMYRWHIDTQWDKEQNPAPLRTFFPIQHWRDSEGEAQDVPLSFLSPYPDVPYYRIDELGRNFIATQDMEAVALLMPHTLGDVPSLTITVGENPPITARPTDLTNALSVLGPMRRYELSQPLQISKGDLFSITAPELLYITGTAIATEGAWDDELPWAACFNDNRPWFRLVSFLSDCDHQNAYALGRYPGLGLGMAENDEQQKYLRMVDILSKVDFYVISSNRFYDALPRPHLLDSEEKRTQELRFPFSIYFYERLFDGELNYTLERTFERTPAFLGINFRDQVLPTSNLPSWMNELEAEESFTVYDHPTVFIFRNQGFQRENLPFISSENDATSDQGQIDLADYRATYTAPENAPTASTLRRDTLVWIFGLWVVGWLVFPMMSLLLPNLPLRGFGFGRGAGWLLLALVPWWLTVAFGLPLWTREALWGGVLLLVLVNAAILARHGRDLWAYVYANAGGFLAFEVLFFAMLGLGLLLRLVNPDLWHIERGGEKPMDFAYLNAILRTPDFPAPAPWLSGYQMNYYYFGFVVAAVPIKLFYTAPEVGFNLALGAIYAVISGQIVTLALAFIPKSQSLPEPIQEAEDLTEAELSEEDTAEEIRDSFFYRINWNRWGRAFFAFVGLLFAMVMGNLGTLKLLLEQDSLMHPNRWYWYPTRIVGEYSHGADNAFSEIPLFAFLYGDLHAHMIALIPVTLLIGAAYALLTQRRLLWGVAIGTLSAVVFMSNSWDVLMYVPIAGVLLLIGAGNWRRFLRVSLYTVIAGLVVVAPYYLDFLLGDNGPPKRWDGLQTPLPPFLLTWGIPIGVIVLWLAYRLKAVLTPEADSPVEIGLIVMGAVLIGLLSPTTATSALCALFVVVGLILAAFDVKAYRPTHLGIALTFAFMLFTEWFVIQGDSGRQNTVFKITFQLWIWFGLLMAVILAHFFQRRMILQGVICLLWLSLGLLYPIKAIPGRYADNQTGDYTLDGNRFMTEMILYQNDNAIITANDADMVRWLRANLEGYPVLMEWFDREYWWNSRVSVQTGFPIVAGWTHHMRQQYTERVAEIEERRIDNHTLYTTTDPQVIRDVLRRYDVEYVIAGELERANAKPESLALLAQMAAEGELEIVYDRHENRVYKVAVLDNSEPLTME